MGCAFVLVVGCAGGRSEAPKEQGHTEVTKEQVHAETTQGNRSQTEGTEEEQGRSRETAPEEVRCGGTRTIDIIGRPFITNDVPGCPNGGLLSGTQKDDKLAGEDGEDNLRGLGASDELFGGYGRDVIYGGRGDDLLGGGTEKEVVADGSKDLLYGGPGQDWVDGERGDDVLCGGDGDDSDINPVYRFGGLYGGPGEDVLYGGEGDDFIRASGDGQQDKLYCGEGRDQYAADKIDWVSSSCEEKVTLVRVE
jgi:hypothetical protein